MTPAMQQTPVRSLGLEALLEKEVAGESQGQRSLVDYSPQGHKESDTTEQLTVSLSLSDTLVQVNQSVQPLAYENQPAIVSLLINNSSVGIKLLQMMSTHLCLWKASDH